MTIHLPKEVENSINNEVLSGRFASAEEAIAAAWLAFVHHHPEAVGPTGLGSIGAMRDAADELDEAVEHAMNLRQRPWRTPAGE
jgi:hypothetical protein